MPRTPDYFKNKTVMITGAGSGLGRAAALAFAREGANVVCADISETSGEETAAMVRENGAQALFVRTDVTSRAEIGSAFDAAIKAFGTIGFLFNSAGAALRRSSFLDIDDDLFDKTFALNVKGTFYAMQAVLPHMLDQGGGVIVNVASMAHKRGGPGTSVHYAASKGAVNTMTMGVAREFADRNIRVLSISPGPIDTPFQSVSSPETLDKFLKDIPMGRFGRAEEAAELVLFMCSDACEFMTAETVYMSGGGGWR